MAMFFQLDKMVLIQVLENNLFQDRSMDQEKFIC